MTDATLGLVIDSSGAQKATVDLDKFASSASKAESAATKMGGSASTVAERDLGKMSEVLGVLEARAEGMASNFGIMGSLLTVMGPEGLAVAAGVGAIAVAIDKMVSSANRMGEMAQGLTNIADTAGITTTQLQGLQLAGDRVGVSSEMMTQSLDMFTVSVQQLRQGTGPLFTELSKISPTLVSQLSATKDTTTAWNLLAQAYHNADEEQKNLIARSASGGRNGVAVGRVLDAAATAGGMNGLVDGLNQTDVLTQQQIQHWNDLKIAIDEASKLASQNFASIFTTQVLEAEKEYYDVILEISRAFKDSSPGATLFKDIASSMLEAVPGLNVLYNAIEAYKGIKGVFTSGPSAASKINDMVGPVPVYPPATSGLTGPAAGPTAQVTAAQAAALVSALGSGATIADKLTASLKKLDAENANNAFGTQGSTEAIKNFNRAVSAVNLDAAIQQIGLYVSALGPLATISDMVRQKMDQVAKAQQQGAGLTGAQVAAIQKYTYETQLGITAINKSADSYTIQAATIDMATGKAAAYAAVMTKVYENIRLGHPLTQQQTADLLASADAMGREAQAAALATATSSATFAGQQIGLPANEATIASQMHNLYGADWQSHMNDALAGQLRMNAYLSDAKTLSTDFMSSFNSDIVKGTVSMQTLVGALQNVESKLLDMAENQAISALFGGMTGGGKGGTGGGILSWISSLFGHNATGTDNWRGGPTWVGENGPEIVNLPKGATVTPNNKITAMMAGASGGTSQPIVVSVAPVYTFNNADPTVEARLRQQIAQSAADTQQKTVAAVQKLSQNSPGNYLPPKR